jgi:hypothetical protein
MIHYFFFLPATKVFFFYQVVELLRAPSMVQFSQRYFMGSIRTKSL